MKILLVRHGKTEGYSERRYWGRTDVKLSATGIEQAERLRGFLASHKIDAFYSSHLQRAELTAEIIAREHNGAVVETVPELGEISFGDLEGMTFEEIIRDYPNVAQSWQEGATDISYPGGESFSQFTQRVLSFVPLLKDGNKTETVLVAAHGGTLRLLICHLLGIETYNWWKFWLDFASLSILETNNRGAVLIALNGTAHLGDGK